MKNSIGMFDFVKGFSVCIIVIGHLLNQFNLASDTTLSVLEIIPLRILY